MVCDGMGGAAAGEVASSLAVDAIYDKLMRDQWANMTRAELAQRLIDAILYANSAILQTARANREQSGMGTTCTAALLHDDVLLIGQVGDSRAYLIRNGTMYQMTKDQTLVNRLLEVGQITPEEAVKFEHNHVILQALGVREKVEPVLSAVELMPGDGLLLCSDGLNDALTDEQINYYVHNAGSTEPAMICKTLTDKACEAGANDNVTVIFARFSGQGYGFTNPGAPVPYVQVPKEQLQNHMLLVRPPIESADTTQVFGSFQLQGIIQEPKP